jgi:DNA-binding CsgD family transcriptional regulator
MTFDVIGAVEACYAGVGDDHAWLSGMLDAVSILARGSGVQAQILRRRGDGSVIVESRLAKGIPPDVLAECDRIFRGAPPDFWSPVPPVDYATTRARRIGNVSFQLERGARGLDLQRHGMEDHFAVFGADLDGLSVGLLINIPVGVPRFSPWVVHRLRSLAAHLTSAVRLRRALDAGAREPAAAARASPDAVLDPAGRALDATGAARERAARARLGEAVRLMEKARGRLRRADPDEALWLWQGLVDGTWSLVEHHEADGKRYLLARRNHPGVREPTALTRQERSVLAFAAMGHQNKYIGYLLGLSPSSVSLLLHSAQRKLGLASRATLIRTFAGVAGPKREGAQSPPVP